MARASSFLAASALVLVAGAAQAEVFYSVDFENGDTEATVGSSQQELTEGSIESVPNPDPDGANASERVGRFRVEASDSKVRAELSGFLRLH